MLKSAIMVFEFFLFKWSGPEGAWRGVKKKYQTYTSVILVFEAIDNHATIFPLFANYEMVQIYSQFHRFLARKTHKKKNGLFLDGYMADIWIKHQWIFFPELYKLKNCILHRYDEIFSKNCVVIFFNALIFWNRHSSSFFSTYTHIHVW